MTSGAQSALEGTLPPMPSMPRRLTRDYVPDETGETEAQWLARLAVEGWYPELGYGVEVVVGGVRRRRWAMIDDLDQHPPGLWPEPGVPGTERPWQRTPREDLEP